MNEELKEQINADMKSFIGKYLFSESSYHPESANYIMKSLMSGFMSTFISDLYVTGREKEALRDLDNWIKVMRDIIKSEQPK